MNVRHYAYFAAIRIFKVAKCLYLSLGGTVYAVGINRCAGIFSFYHDHVIYLLNDFHYIITYFHAGLNRLFKKIASLNQCVTRLIPDETR